MQAPGRLCFVVMPFGVKETGAGKDAPAQVDFDRLWSVALKPLLEEDLGYDAHRADLGQGVSIVREMIEQLALAHLVVADLSIPNPNVYYEIGVRHAARPKGCVLVSADWATPPFDTRGFRHVRYPLTDGSVPQVAAGAIRAALRDSVRRLSSAATPCFELPDFPDIDPQRALAFRSALDAERAFELRLEAARLKPGEERAREIAEIVRETTGTELSPRAALQVLLLARDHGRSATPGTLDRDGWDAVMKFVDALPEDLRTAIVLREIEGMSYEDIAVTMDCPIGTVRSRIFRAREAIDEKLKPLLGGN
jgi:DNA-directed RNA polymerase specialized sigma24 family protein